jgi:hypothetical protein
MISLKRPAQRAILEVLQILLIALVRSIAI